MDLILRKELALAETKFFRKNTAIREGTIGLSKLYSDTQISENPTNTVDIAQVLRK